MIFNKTKAFLIIGLFFSLFIIYGLFSEFNNSKKINTKSFSEFINEPIKIMLLTDWGKLDKELFLNTLSNADPLLIIDRKFALNFDEAHAIVYVFYDWNIVKEKISIDEYYISKEQIELISNQTDEISTTYYNYKNPEKRFFFINLSRKSSKYKKGKFSNEYCLSNHIIELISKLAIDRVPLNEYC